MEKRDLVVIGGGPAGYVAALRASQLGSKATLIEEKVLGGTCINRGCIPTKSLLHTVDILQSIKTAGEYGIAVTGVNVDLPKMQAHKNKVVSQMVAGLAGRLTRSKVEIIEGRAKLTPSKQIEVVSGPKKGLIIQTGKAIIATGSKPIKLPIPGADNPDIMGTDELLNLASIPESMAIIGGGVIGVEMATVFSKLGCKISIFEMMPHCLPSQDAEIAAILEDVLKKDGIAIYCRSKVKRIENSGEGKLVTFTDGANKENSIKVKAVALCVGYQPNSKDLGLEECGVALKNNSIVVNERMVTTVPNIYAAGDVTGGLMLAYVGFAEGKVAAENVMGKSSHIDYQAVPQCIFTLPEVACVGLTEEEATAQGYKLQIGKFPFVANGMATILGENRGFVKLITEKKYGQILGAHIIGPRATSLIPEIAIAMKSESTVREIVNTMHAHPTLSEAVWESALDVIGETLHYSTTNS